MLVKLLIVLFVFAFIGGSIFAIIALRRKKSFQIIEKKLAEITGAVEVKKMQKKSYDFLVTSSKYQLLVKVVFNRADEICINAKNYWQVSSGAVNSRKKGEKIPGIYGLINETNFPECNKPFRKIYVIYPNVTRLMRAVNECEIIFLKPTDLVFGVRVVRFGDLCPDILQKI